MDSSDDEGQGQFPLETVTQLIKGCEEFVKTKISELSTSVDRENSLMKTQMQHLEKENEQLKKKVEELEKKVESTPKCRCEEVFNGFVEVGRTLFNGGQIVIQNASSEQAATEPTCDQILDPKEIPTSLYKADQYVGHDPTLAMSSLTCSNVTPGKRSETSLIYTEFEQLNCDLQTKLRPFATPRSKLANKDMLNDVQRAFVAYFLHKNKNSKLTPSRLAEACMKEGEEERVWTQNFVLPESTTEFRKYLRQRIKNALNRKAVGSLRDLLTVQVKRLESEG